jgi:alpha-tubulin suppressor-like RCC1 family protein
VVAQWNDPVQWIAKEYNRHIVLIDMIFEANALNPILIYDLQLLQPRVSKTVWCGAFTSFALTVDALMACGQNVYDQLGKDGGQSHFLFEEIELKETIISVSCGFAHTMILTPHGLAVLGLNDRGQLGVGTHRESSLQAHPLKHVIEVACGERHTLFLTTEALYASGDNAKGQLGTGNVEWSPFPLIIEEELMGVWAIAAGAFHSFALAFGGLYAWGNNAFGQLGLGHKDNIKRPQKVRLPKEVGRVIAVAGGIIHSMLLSESGALYVCGDNKYGQLGGTIEEQTVWSKLTIVGEPIIRGFALGGYFSMMWSDYTLFACGENGYGQLGTGDKKDRLQVVQVMLEQPVFSVACGYFHTIILASDGLYTCGNNRDGQLGLGESKDEVLIPTKVPLVVGHETSIY